MGNFSVVELLFSRSSARIFFALFDIFFSWGSMCLFFDYSGFSFGNYPTYPE